MPEDQVIEQYLLENVHTTWHALETCKMTPREDMGVVDGSLSVDGVRRLKVVDLSVSPPPGNAGADKNNVSHLQQLVQSYETENLHVLLTIIDGSAHWRKRRRRYHQRRLPKN